jgi:hypothetical protein
MASVIIQFAFIIFLPALAALGSAYFGRVAVSRPWLFFLVAAVILYVAYVAIFYAVAETLVGGVAISKPDPASAVPVRSLTPNLLIFYAKPLLVFVVVAAPILFVLNRLFHRS